MDKKTLIAVGAGVAVALGALAYFVLTPSSEVRASFDFSSHHTFTETLGVKHVD